MNEKQKDDVLYLLNVIRFDLEGGQMGEWELWDAHKWECMIKILDDVIGAIDDEC